TLHIRRDRFSFVPPLTRRLAAAREASPATQAPCGMPTTIGSPLLDRPATGSQTPGERMGHQVCYEAHFSLHSHEPISRIFSGKPVRPGPPKVRLRRVSPLIPT